MGTPASIDDKQDGSGRHERFEPTSVDREDKTAPPGTTLAPAQSDADKLIRELESQWSMHSVVRKDGQHEFKESKEMLKARILQLEAEVSSLAGKLKGQAQMSEVLLQSLGREVDSLNSHLKVLESQNIQRRKAWLKGAPAVKCGNLNWPAILLFWASSSLLLAIAVATYSNPGLPLFISSIVCVSASAIWLAFPRWRSCTEDSALALDDSSPHGLMQAIETASFAAYSHVPMGESDHEMTTSDLISRLQMLTRRSMSISTCSEEDTLERYVTARSSAFQEEYSRIEGSGPGIEVSFGVEEHTQPPQDTIKAESSLQRSQCIAEGQKPDTLPDTRGRQQNVWTEQDEMRDRADPGPGSDGPRAGPPSLDDFNDWPDSPILVKPVPTPGQSYSDLTKGRALINTGRRLEFESPLFKGCAVIWIKGLQSAPEDLFVGKQRRTMLTIQGQFKQAVSLDDLCTGQEFFRSAKNLPPQWIVESVLVKIAKSISPSMSIGPMSSPYVLVPIVTGAQLINVALPGTEPDCTQTSIPEDMTLFDPQLSGKQGSPVSASRRQKFFRNPENRKIAFSQEHVWTFCIYQSQVNMSTYQLDVGLKFDLCRHLDGQPMQFMLKDRSSGRYICNFHAWHKKLINAAEEALDTADNPNRPKA